MHTYVQATGKFLVDQSNIVGLGYSGANVGKNNSAMESVPFVGPIPRGVWLIIGAPFDDPEHGKYCIRLEPAPGTSALGRDGFLIHGDSFEHPGAASEGCIIQSYGVRQAIVKSGVKEVNVI